MKDAQRNIEQKNSYSSNHLQKDMLDFGKQFHQKSLGFVIP